MKLKNESESINEVVEAVETVAVEVVKAPVKMVVKLVEDLFNWFDGD